MPLKRTLLGLVGGIAIVLVSAPAAAQPEPTADMSITKTAPATAAVGANIIYTVTVANAGPDDSEFVQMIDTLSADVTFVSITQDSGPAFDTLATPAVGATGPVNAAWTSFPNGAAAVFTLTVNATAAFTGPVTNTATVNADFLDPQLINNAATAVTQVAAEADLAVTKTGPANGAPGTTVSYTLTATNNGPNEAANVSLTDTLPAGVTFVSLAQNTGPASTPTTPAVGGGGTVTATWATLASGASATFTLTVNVGSGFSGDLLNTASIAAVTADPNAANNTSTAMLAVTTSTTTTTTTTTTPPTTTTTLATTTSTTIMAGLPATGRNSGQIQIAAIAAVMAGIALIVAARRRTQDTG